MNQELRTSNNPDVPAISSSLSVSRPLDWNGPVERLTAPCPDADADLSITERFEAVVRRFPERTAIIDSEGDVSYRQLHQLSLALAGAVERSITRDGLV